MPRKSCVVAPTDLKSHRTVRLTDIHVYAGFSRCGLVIFYNLLRFDIVNVDVPYLRPSLSDRMFAICDCFKSRDNKFFVT